MLSHAAISTTVGYLGTLTLDELAAFVSGVRLGLQALPLGKDPQAR